MSEFENLGEDTARAMVNALIEKGYSEDDAFGKVYSIECNMDNEDPNNSKEINANKKRYLVGTTVELAIEANSLSEAKDILYKKLKTMGLDVGTLNGFEIPDDDDDEE